jgi:hypothetical protein
MSKSVKDKNDKSSNLIGFGKRLYEAGGGGSFKEVAFSVKIEYDTVRRYLQNEREPDFKTLSHISEVTNCSIHWLLTGEGPKTVRRIDYKNLWARIVRAWEREFEDSGDLGLRIELDSAKEMSQRNFMPDFNAVQRVSIITHTPLLWLLTGDGEARAEKPFENPPAYLADLIVDYKAKAELPLPLKNKLMSTEIHNGDYQPEQFEHGGKQKEAAIAFSVAEEVALDKLTGGKFAREEKVREIVVSHLLAQGLISLNDILKVGAQESILTFDTAEDERRLRASRPRESKDERASKEG